MMGGPERMKIRPSTAVGIAAVMLLSFGYGYLSNDEARPRVVTSAGDIPVFDGDGNPKAIELEVGKGPTLMFVVSTSCRFCAETTPAWRQILHQVALDSSESVRTFLLSYSSPDPTRVFTEQYGLTGVPVLYMDGDSVRSLSAWSVPATIVVDERTNARSWDGVLSDADVEQILRLLERHQ
jgi:hypothetical protein